MILKRLLPLVLCMPLFMGSFINYLAQDWGSGSPHISMQPAAGGVGYFTCAVEGASDLACEDFQGSDDATTTGNCDGATSFGTIDWADTGGDMECDDTVDGSEVMDFQSGNDSCNSHPGATDEFGWGAAWSPIDITYVSFCLKVDTASSYNGMTIMMPLNANVTLGGQGGTNWAIKMDAATDDQVGLRCGGQGTIAYHSTDVIDLAWHGVVLKIDVTTDSEVSSIWVDDSDTSTGSVDCTSVASDTNFDGWAFMMCETDDASFGYQLDNLRIHSSLPSDGSVSGLQCGDS
jgi:hypothetical protein